MPVPAADADRRRLPPGDFLRGLFHSDDIRGFCTDALDLVGVPWRQSSWKTISVSTRAGVARLDELVGPKTWEESRQGWRW